MMSNRRRRADGCSATPSARKFMSSLLGDGGIGKTAVRYAQLMSLATADCSPANMYFNGAAC